MAMKNGLVLVLVISVTATVVAAPASLLSPAGEALRVAAAGGQGQMRLQP